MMSFPAREHGPMASRIRKRGTNKRSQAKSADVTDQLTTVLDQLRQHAHDLDIQFRRIADIQADIDDLKRRLKGRKARG